MTTQKKNIGLVLSGGGARGAYQVGVLSAIADISRDLGLDNPFTIYTGVSAGAINASYLAAGAEDFAQTTKKLVDLWSRISSDNVFYTDAMSLGKIGFKWLEELSLGAIAGTTPGRALLDTRPLRELISSNMQFENIQRNIDAKKLRAVAITAMDYQSSTGITFVQGNEDIKLWTKARRLSQRAVLKAEHVMASAAIPMLFPPVQVGNSFFGDGCVRNQSPCGPAIYLGAEKLMVIGVKTSNMVPTSLANAGHPPSIARVANVLLNSVLLDGIEIDLERMENINKLVSLINANDTNKTPMKQVQFASVSPSIDIGNIAYQKSTKMPRLIRYLLKGLGSLEDAREIVSYLLFEPTFCTHLIEVGFEDGMRNKESIKQLLTE